MSATSGAEMSYPYKLLNSALFLAAWFRIAQSLSFV
jgi:hypothetical protein